MPGRVEEDHLPARIVPHAEDPVARRLRLVRDDGELLADEAVEQRRFAGVGPADERDEAGTSSTARSRRLRARLSGTRRRMRTLCTRRRSASSTST